MTSATSGAPPPSATMRSERNVNPANTPTCARPTATSTGGRSGWIDSTSRTAPPRRLLLSVARPRSGNPPALTAIATATATNSTPDGQYPTRPYRSPKITAATVNEALANARTLPYWRPGSRRALTASGVRQRPDRAVEGRVADVQARDQRERERQHEQREQGGRTEDRDPQRPCAAEDDVPDVAPDRDREDRGDRTSSRSAGRSASSRSRGSRGSPRQTARTRPRRCRSG